MNNSWDANAPEQIPSPGWKISRWCYHFWRLYSGINYSWDANDTASDSNSLNAYSGEGMIVSEDYIPAYNELFMRCKWHSIRFHFPGCKCWIGYRHFRRVGPHELIMRCKSNKMIPLRLVRRIFTDPVFDKISTGWRRGELFLKKMWKDRVTLAWSRQQCE